MSFPHLTNRNARQGSLLCVQCNVKLGKRKKDEKNKNGNDTTNNGVTTTSGSSSVQFHSIFEFNYQSV